MWVADQEMVDGSDWFFWFRDDLMPAVSWAARFGVVPLPVHFDGQRAPGKHVGIKGWKEWSLLDVWMNRIRDVSGWCFQPGSCRTGDLVVVDIDHPDFVSMVEAVGWDPSQAVRVTRSGSWNDTDRKHKIHLYFRSEVRPETDVKPAFGADWLVDQQVVLGPGSKHAKGEYRWFTGPLDCTAEELPLLVMPELGGAPTPLPSNSKVGKAGVGDFCPPGEGRNDWTTRFLMRECSELIRKYRPGIGDLATYEDELERLVLRAWANSPGHDWEQFQTEYSLSDEIQRAWDKAHADTRNMTYGACQVFFTEKGGLRLKYDKPRQTKDGKVEFDEKFLTMGDPTEKIDTVLRAIPCVDPRSDPSVKPSVRLRLTDGRVFGLHEVLQFSAATTVPDETGIKADYGLSNYGQVVPHLYQRFGVESYAIPTGFWRVSLLHPRIRHGIPPGIDWVFLFPSGKVVTNRGVWHDANICPIEPFDIAPDHLRAIPVFVPHEGDTSPEAIQDMRDVALQLLHFHDPTYIVPLAGYYTAAVLQGWFKDFCKMTVPHLGVTGASQSGKSTYASAAARKLHGLGLEAGVSEPAAIVGLGMSRAGVLVIDDSDKDIEKMVESSYRAGYDGGTIGNTKRRNPVWGRLGMLAEDLSYITSDKANARRTLLLTTPMVNNRPSILGGGSQADDFIDLNIEDRAEAVSQLWVEALLDTISRIDPEHVRQNFFGGYRADSSDSALRVAKAGMRIYLATALDYRGDPFDEQWNPVIDTAPAYRATMQPLTAEAPSQDPLEHNLFIAAFRAWHVQYRNRFYQQWGWSQTYINRFSKVKWADSKYGKGLGETINSEQVPLVILDARITFKLDDLAKWYRGHAEKDGLRSKSCNAASLREAARALGLTVDKAHPMVDKDTGASFGRWWRFSVEDTEAVLDYLNIPAPTEQDVEKAQQLALEDK